MCPYAGRPWLHGTIGPDCGPFSKQTWALLMAVQTLDVRVTETTTPRSCHRPEQSTLSGCNAGFDNKSAAPVQSVCVSQGINQIPVLGCVQRRGSVKLVDFGLSCFHRDGYDQPLTSFVGTTHYASPELIEGRYAKMVDVWSVGVLLYILLSGCMPFIGGNNRELFNSILNDDLDFSLSSVWRYGDITPNAKDLIQLLLVKDPIGRISPKKALLHPWFPM